MSAAPEDWRQVQIKGPDGRTREARCLFPTWVLAEHAIVELGRLGHGVFYGQRQANGWGIIARGSLLAEEVNTPRRSAAVDLSAARRRLQATGSGDQSELGEDAEAQRIAEVELLWEEASGERELTTIGC